MQPCLVQQDQTRSQRDQEDAAGQGDQEPETEAHRPGGDRGGAGQDDQPAAAKRHRLLDCLHDFKVVMVVLIPSSKARLFQYHASASNMIGLTH